MRCYLLKLSDSSYKVVLALHHIISDGWSMNILERDFGAIYNSYLTGAELDLPDLRIQYKDYTHWQNKEITSGGLAVDRSYWMDRLSGELPTLELPTDYSRPSVMSYKGATLRGVIPKERVEILETLSHSFGGTLFMGLTAVLYGLLHRYSGQEDIILGTPIAGRNHPDLSDQVGFYVNTLCLRLGIRGVDSFEELLQRVVEMMLESYDHQSYPFDLLIEDLDVRHDLSRSPLFDIMVVKGEDLTKGGSFEQNSDLQISKFDMTVTYQKYGDDVLIHLNYNSDIYDHHRIQQMIDHLQGFLLSVTSSPSQELRYVDYLTTSERECLLQSFNGSVTANGDTGLPTVLDKMRSNHTGLDNSLALISGDTEISYGLLHSRSNQLACHLHSRGDLHSGDLIGVIMGRTERMVISILGILKGGFVYVPIDPNYPESRKDYIISDSGLKLVITDLQFESSSVDVLQIPDVPEWDSLDSDYLAVDINSNDGAYVIYTSGSTGNPKGVLVEHGSLMNLCNWYIENVDLDNGSNSTFYTSIGFDASIVEIWPNLVAGARLHILSEELRHDIGLLERYIVEEEITHCFLPTIVCEEFMTSYPSKNHKNTLFLTGGEKLTKAIPGYRLINCYGPTETTVMATSIKIADVQQLSLGRPLPNMQVYILDKNDQLMPIGYQGEICISGLGVSRGYLNRPDLTSSKFVPNPYDTEGMMYRTGDLGRWLKDGNLIFEGRKDNQVKVRGYRIELGEIESAILAFKGVNETKVLVTTGNTLSESELIAYYTGDLEDKDKLRTHLIEQLPLYMIPYQILKLEEFPLTAHGKVDVLSLSQYTRSVDNPSYTKASSSMENSLVEIWEEVLQVSPIGIHDNFFELGGHSLNATHVISRLYKLFGIDLPFADLFKLGTISKLARKLSDQESISYKGI
ncbi:MAG: amino acid adenylation domain-containing protein, partial [Bacteroidota bacterium]